MKSERPRIILALLAALGFSGTTTSCVMYGPPDIQLPDSPVDTTIHTMYGVPVSDFARPEATLPEECPEAGEEDVPYTEDR